MIQLEIELVIAAQLLPRSVFFYIIEGSRVLHLREVNLQTQSDLLSAEWDARQLLLCVLLRSQRHHGAGLRLHRPHRQPELTVLSHQSDESVAAL